MRKILLVFWGMRTQDYLLTCSDRKTFANFQLFSQTQELFSFSVQLKKSAIFSFCLFQTNILLKKSSSDLQANLK